MAHDIIYSPTMSTMGTRIVPTLELIEASSVQLETHNDRQPRLLQMEPSSTTVLKREPYRNLIFSFLGDQLTPCQSQIQSNPPWHQRTTWEHQPSPNAKQSSKNVHETAHLSHTIITPNAVYSVPQPRAASLNPTSPSSPRCKDIPRRLLSSNLGDLILTALAHSPCALQVCLLYDRPWSSAHRLSWGGSATLFVVDLAVAAGTADADGVVGIASAGAGRVDVVAVRLLLAPVLRFSQCAISLDSTTPQE